MATVSLLGRLTENPVSKTLNDNRLVADFDLADNHGNNETTYYSCAVFGKQAELIAASCLKGHRLYVAGTLKGRKYTGNNGQTGMSLDLVVNEFRFVEPAAQQQQPAAPPQQPAQPPYQLPQAPAAAPPYQYDQAGNQYQVVNGAWVMTQRAQAPAPAPTYVLPGGAPPFQPPAGTPPNRPY